MMKTDPQTATLRTEVPLRLLTELEALVQAGWSRDIDAIVLEALRRYLDSHRQELMEQFIQEDVEWGLHGSD